MKFDGLFLIGDTNIFDYQKLSGFRRWNTWSAAGRPVSIDIILP